MTMTRKKTVNVVYNGIEVWKSLDPYLESFSYFDSVDESDKISFSVNDRDLKWVNSWIPQTGDVIQPSVILENWNYEGEKMTVACGDFEELLHKGVGLVDDGLELLAAVRDFKD